MDEGAIQITNLMSAQDGKAEFLERLFSAVCQRYSLVHFGERGCPVYCVAAIPKEGESAGEAWLPPAARPKARRAAMGRGLSLEQAMLSCLGEAVELVSSCFWGGEHLVPETHRKLDQKSITLDELIFISDAQYDAQEDWNRRLEGISRLPDRNHFTSAWINGRSLTRKESCLIPAEYALIGFEAEPDVPHAYVGNSTGCAAGPTLDEAIVSGFLELVERDAASIWWYGLHRRPEISIERQGNCQDIAEWFSKRGRTCQVLDISTDLGIPVCAAVSSNPDGADLKIGFAASFSWTEAIEKGLSELVQLVLANDLKAKGGANAEDHIGRLRLPDELSPEQRVDLHTLPEIHQGVVGPETCSKLCLSAGLELLVIDLTRDSLATPVARVIAPGLRQTLPAFGPGRLYDVARRLGWLKSQDEKSLCSHPLPG